MYALKKKDSRNFLKVNSFQEETRAFETRNFNLKFTQFILDLDIDFLRKSDDVSFYLFFVPTTERTSVDDVEVKNESFVGGVTGKVDILRLEPFDTHLVVG